MWLAKWLILLNLHGSSSMNESQSDKASLDSQVRAKVAEDNPPKRVNHLG